jgi:GTP-binding protein HflX
VLLSDTIGFIRDLPPSLVSAFRSTLEETVQADLILHVIDASDAHLHEKIAEVEDILVQLGASETKKIYVFNKMDAVKKLDRKTLYERYADMSPVFVSCVSGDGLEDLKATIASQFPSAFLTGASS